MQKSPAFQFYVSDFLVGTSRMSAEQIGGYILLLCEQWDKGALPDDDQELSEISRVKIIKLGIIKKKFLKGDDGLLRNPRLERERDKQLQYREKQAVNGAKGGRPLKQKENPEKPNPFSGLTQTKAKKRSSSSTSSSTSLEIDTNVSISESAYSFEDFWNAYGKKKDLHRSQALWNKLSQTERQLAMQAIPDYVRSTPDIQFRKNPTTWLNGKCWKDEPNLFQAASNGESGKNVVMRSPFGDEVIWTQEQYDAQKANTSYKFMRAQ